MKKDLYIKLAAVSIITAIILVLGFTPAYAQETKLNFFTCITSPFTCAVYGLTYIIVSIMSLLVALGAWMTSQALNFSESIIQSPAVSAGFKVSLSIANLGFVAAIIVVAIATILRSQTYGIKKILWKLVVAALLVNFSLVIAGTILAFADGFSKFFIDKASPHGITGFVNKLTSAFAPQDLLRPPDPNSSFWAKVGEAFQQRAGLDAFITTVLNMVFVIIFMLLIAFTFIALAVLLLIRYVYLGVLLILMPFAWLLWIFPGFQSNWSKWWHNFLKWTFFAPIALFFLYLATFTAINRQSEISGIVNKSTADTLDPAGFQGQSLAILTQNPGLLGNTGEKIIVLALALGGLFAANSLSIVGAKAAYGAATAGVKGFSGALVKKPAGAAARFATHGPKPPPTPPPAGAGRLKQALYRVKSRMHAVGTPLRAAAQATTQRILPPKTFTNIQAFGTAAAKSPGPFGALWGGMKKGSGIFKGKQVNDWECQNCASQGLTPHIIRATKKPTVSCPNCGAPASVANWTQV